MDTDNLLYKLNPKDYTLSFTANGVSVLVTDLHKDVYSKMHVLFIIDHGTFRQYFPKKNYNQALNTGLNFYRNNSLVNNYLKNIHEHNKIFRAFFNSSIKNKSNLNKQTLQIFFHHTAKLCTDYTKMNVEFTDKAFSKINENTNIKINLDKVSAYKDKVRSFMNTVLFEKAGYSQIVFKILHKQFKLPIAILENLTQKELLSLYDHQFPNNQQILKRQNAFVLIWNKNIPIEGNKAKLISKKFQEKIITVNEITGTIANKGKAIGRVKIIPVDYSDMRKINKEIQKMKIGQILLAETTAPELILACKKAKAIVTDIGGLMSHAAIVSRELKIPCIIGTKIATKIFRDGDIIEVDANKGIVKKIK